jgi:hypothetical protein
MNSCSSRLGRGIALFLPFCDEFPVLIPAFGLRQHGIRSHDSLQKKCSVKGFPLRVARYHKGGMGENHSVRGAIRGVGSGRLACVLVPMIVGPQHARDKPKVIENLTLINGWHGFSSFDEEILHQV